MARDIYLALGDSITAGHGATQPMSGFVYRLSQRLRNRGYANRFMVVAKSGWTTRQLLYAIRRIPESIWSDVGVVTICIGGNDLRQLLRRRIFSVGNSDFLSQEDVRKTIIHVSHRMNELCNLLQKRRIPLVSMATVYNPVPHSSFAESAICDLNQVISACARRYGYRLTNLHAAIQGQESFTIDGYRHGELEDLLPPFRRPIHPNDDGHRRISDAFAATFIKATGQKSARNQEHSMGAGRRNPKPKKERVKHTATSSR